MATANREVIAHFKFKFWGEVVPSIVEVNSKMKPIGNPHVEVSEKNEEDGSRTFEAKITKPGYYHFKNFHVDESSPYFQVIYDLSEGWFVVSADGSILFADE